MGESPFGSGGAVLELQGGLNPVRPVVGEIVNFEYDEVKQPRAADFGIDFMEARGIRLDDWALGGGPDRFGSGVAGQRE